MPIIFSWQFLALALIQVISFTGLPVVMAEDKVDKTYLVGYAQDTMANDWRAAQVRELEKEFAKHHNIRFIYTDAKGNALKQIQDIEDLAYQKVDVLMTSPMNAVLSTPVISKIYKSGIPVVLITRDIKNNNYTSLVAPDDKQIAKQAAQYMANKMGKAGRLLILRGVPTATTAIARTEGFLSEIRKYPGIKVVAIKNGNYLRADAIKAVRAVIDSGEKFDAIFAQSDSMASGARLALKKAGIKPESKLIVGIDYINEARQAIRAGEQAASFLYPTSGKQAVETVVKILQGGSVSKRVVVKSQIITKHNVDKISPIF